MSQGPFCKSITPGMLCNKSFLVPTVEQMTAEHSRGFHFLSSGARTKTLLESLEP